MKTQTFEAGTRDEALALAENWIKSRPQIRVVNQHISRFGAGTHIPGTLMEGMTWRVFVQYEEPPPRPN